MTSRTESQNQRITTAAILTGCIDRHANNPMLSMVPAVRDLLPVLRAYIIETEARLQRLEQVK